MKRSPGLSLHPRPQRPPAHSMQRKVHHSTAWHTSRSRCGPLPRTPGLPAALLADAICDHSRAATRPPGAPSARAPSLCAARSIEPRDCTAPTRWPAPLDGLVAPALPAGPAWRMALSRGAHRATTGRIVIAPSSGEGRDMIATRHAPSQPSPALQAEQGGRPLIRELP